MEEKIFVGEQDIKVDLINSFPNHPYHVFDDADMSELVASIKANGLLNPIIVRNTVIKINTGYRNFNLLNLTEIGALAYINKFKQKPAIQEHVLIHSHHASYHHGYMIKDTKTILERIGLYRDVETRRDKNTIQFYDGAICIPDIIAVMSNSEAHYYEVECGNHHQFDINEKCDKLARLTKHIIYVGQNRKSVCGVLRKQLEAWIEYRGREELRHLGIKVYLTTISDLSDKKWTYFYDMKTNKPICCFKEKEEK